MPKTSGRPALLCTTAEDESFILGTRSQLIKLAERILELTDAPAEPSDWDGVAVEQPACATYLSDPMSDIALQGIVIVRTEADRRALMNKIRVNDALDPIDWEGHD